MNISLVESTGLYYIIERIYPRDGLIPDGFSFGGISPSLVQVYRMVISLSKKQDMYMEGKKINPADITLWQTIKYSFGAPVHTKYTGDLVYTLAFSGSLASFSLLPDSDVLDIPKNLTKPRTTRFSPTVNYGKDPIPNIILYGNKNVKFTMDNGGIDTPTAMAKYNSNTKETKFITDKTELAKSMLDMKKHGIKL
ncbi:hypothetical protein [Pantoea ananatis]|uniref:hypothetical protein n=1 Tax=Pantoea ananas TaxID=553 RepID=UPI000FEC288F|nr:hypothetical protein [Pantoea ananatis]QAB29730.1 hypothetical protein EPK90_08045 [Pantoea ananatis]